MSEDQFLILAPKSMVSSLFGDGTDSGGQENGGGVLLNNDITLHLCKGSSGPLDETRRKTKGEIRKLVNHVETWKTHDDVNFVKSADVTHFLDFGDATRAGGDCLRQNELLRCKSNHEDASTPEQVNNTSANPVDSVAEEALMHTLTHGLAKCTTTVEFMEEFEDAE